MKIELKEITVRELANGYKDNSEDGVAFIFKKRNFPIGDDVLISTSNIKALEEFIKDIKNDKSKKNK